MKAYRVFIGCIPGNSQAQELMDLLGGYARVVSIKLAMDRNQKDKEYCLGYGFAVCQTKEDMDALLAQANQIKYKGRFITLREYKVGSRLKEDKKLFNQRRLFIGNVPQQIKAEELRVIFAKYGSIENIYFVDQSVQQSYKYGYVVFHDENSAQNALNEKVNLCIGNARLRVESFGGKKTSSQLTIKEHTKANTNSHNKERTIGNPSAESLGSYGIEPQAQYNTALGPTTSGPAQLQNSKFQFTTGNQESSQEALADGSNYWRKLHFKKNKTFSLESSPIFQATCFGEPNQFSLAEQVSVEPSSQHLLRGCQFQPPGGVMKPLGTSLTTFDPFTGWQLLSDGRAMAVDSNHQSSNMRMNRRKVLTGLLRPF